MDIYKKTVKMKAKKGIGYGAMAWMVLALFIAIALFSNTALIAQILKKDSNIEICKLSVLAQAQTKLAGSSLAKLDCERRKVVFFEDKIEINNKKEPKYEFKKIDQNMVNKVVAEELRLCWYMMGEGQMNVFEQEPVDIAIQPIAEKVCAICSEVSFDKSVKQKEFSGFIDYLKSTKIPKGEIHYFEYLIRSQRDKYFLWGWVPWTQYSPWGWGTTDRISDNMEGASKEYDETQTDSDFSSYKRYVVYFLASKPTWLKEKFGHTTSAYYIGIATPSKVIQECTRLAN